MLCIIFIPPQGPKPKIILLTPKCFKKLCMQSKTKKAELVRDYYIVLEELVDKYKDLIIENKDKEINILKNDLKKHKFPSGGSLLVNKPGLINQYKQLNKKIFDFFIKIMFIYLKKLMN